jgi:hypothetical protein
VGWIATDPLPHPMVFANLPLDVEERSGFRYLLTDQSMGRYQVMVLSDGRYAVFDWSTMTLAVEEQSRPKFNTDDTA